MVEFPSVGLRRLLAAIALCLACYYYLLDIRNQEREGITYGPMLNRDIEREVRLARLYHGTEAHCISELRMRKSVFHRLCGYLRSRGLLTDTLHVTVEEQVAMFMHVVEGGENSSSSTPRSGANRPRPKGMKSPGKKPSKPKSRLSEATEVFSSTMQSLAKAFAEPPPPPPVPKLDHNPYANLWKRLEALPLRTEDKINVGVYLARPKCEARTLA
ncbi:hypothetical protein EJB05_25715, partial [Eragrostis curvula]